MADPVQHCSDLCKRCSDLDLERVLDPASFSADLYDDNVCSSTFQHITRLGYSHGPWIDQDCPLCRLFHRVLPPPRIPNGLEPSFNIYYLHAIASSVLFNYTSPEIKRSNFLAILTDHPTDPSFEESQHGSIYSSGTIARLDEGSKQYVHKVGRDVPFESINNWHQYCQTKHGDQCNQTRSMQHIETRFVDCIRNEIVAATTAVAYVALSYVWGQHRTDRSQRHSSALLRDLPQTIADAMTATVNLGYRYLWVDQLCIPASNASVFARQVSQMDEIYHDAELVLIAAAGTNSNYGLPGVGIRKRSVQACER